jgi:hypothetical protein
MDPSSLLVLCTLSYTSVRFCLNMIQLFDDSCLSCFNNITNYHFFSNLNFFSKLNNLKPIYDANAEHDFFETLPFPSSSSFFFEGNHFCPLEREIYNEIECAFDVSTKKLKMAVRDNELNVFVVATTYSLHTLRLYSPLSLLA